MKTIKLKSRHIDMKKKTGSISMSYKQFKLFKGGIINYLVIDEKTHKTIELVNFNDITGYVYMYRYVDIITNEIKHTPNKTTINGIITKSFMVCNF